MAKTKREFNRKASFWSWKNNPACPWLRLSAATRYERENRRVLAGAKQNENVSGSASLSFAIIFFVLLAGILYIYSINGSAVKGYKMRQAEKEINGLKKENEKLIIKEAELKSLYNIEEASKKLNMNEMNNISYVDEKSPVALK